MFDAFDRDRDGLLNLMEMNTFLLAAEVRPEDDMSTFSWIGDVSDGITLESFKNCAFAHMVVALKYTLQIWG